MNGAGSRAEQSLCGGAAKSLSDLPDPRGFDHGTRGRTRSAQIWPFTIH
jgi:hypothetical protein